MRFHQYGWSLLPGLLVLLALFLFSLISIFLLPLQQRYGRIWDGYYMLLVDRGASCDAVVERLLQAGFERVVAECTATVALNGFGPLETVPLPQLSSRLDPIDPRFDRYMRDLPSWFRTRSGGEAASLFYVAGDESPWIARRRIAAALSAPEIQWRFPEGERGSGYLFGAAYLLAAAILVGRSAGFRIAAGAAALPWPAGVFLGGLPAFGTAMVVYAATVMALEVMHADARELRRQFPVRILIWPALAVALSLAVSPESGLLGRFPVVSGAVGSAALILICTLLQRARRRRSEHSLFTPVALLAGGRAAARPVRSVLPLVALIAVAAPLIYAVAPRRDVPYVPEPELLADDSLSFETLQRLAANGNEGGPPSLADYVAHRAFQEAFMYGREWGVPELGEVLSRQRIAWNGATLERTNEILVEYTAGWLAHVLDDSPRGGVEAILLAQPRPARVVLRPMSKLYFDRSFLARHAVLSGVLAAPYLGYAAGKRGARRRRHELLQRSFRQHA